MKILLLTILTLTSTFAFSETRSEFKTELKENLENKLDNTNARKLVSAGFGSLYGATAVAAIHLDATISNTIKQSKQAPELRMDKARKYTLKFGAAALWFASYTMLKRYSDLDEKSNKIETELTEIENGSRNTREKTTKTSNKKTIREISAIDMN